MGFCIGVSSVDLKNKSKQDVCTHALGGLACGASQRPVAVDLLDDRPLEDRRDDLELPAAAVRAVLQVEIEHALEQPRALHQLTCSKRALCERRPMAGIVISRPSPIAVLRAAIAGLTNG
jgi:hypothetical protein